MQNHKMIFAHRGLYGVNAPENSLSAFQNALEAEMGIELDVRLTSDGVPIVFHDKTLKRMCDDKRKISNVTVEELQTLSLGSTKEKIPSLKQVLELVDGKQPLLIEIKSSRWNLCDRRLEHGVLALLNKYSGEYFIQSFNRHSVKYLKKRLPKIECGILSGNLYSEPTGFDFINYKLSDMTEEKSMQLHEKYPRVFGWGGEVTDVIEAECIMNKYGLDAIVM